MGIRNRLSGLFGYPEKKHPDVSSDTKKLRDTSVSDINAGATDAQALRSTPESYYEKQKNFSCIVTLTSQDAAIEISKAIDSSLKIWSEVGMKNGDIAVFVKPDCDINRAKKIVMDVLQKELRKDSSVKWRLQNFVKDDRRKYKRLNLVYLDKHSVLSMLDDTAIRNEKSKIDFHQSVFAVYNGKTGAYFGELIDISQGGLKIFSQVPFRKNTTYYMEIDFRPIKHIKQKILFDAVCVYINTTLSNDYFISGFKFTGIDSIELKYINRFIELFSKLD